MMSMSIFDIKDTPIPIRAQVGAKNSMMRFLGTNDWSSVTCGIIEALIQNKSAKSLSNLRPLTNKMTSYPQQIKDVIKIIEQLISSHAMLTTEAIKYFYDSLRAVDRQNISLGNYICDQIKQRFNVTTNMTLDQTSLKHFIPQFNICLNIYGSDGGSITINSQADITVYLYQAREGNYYCFSSINQNLSSKAANRGSSQAPMNNLSQSLVTPKCQMCFKISNLALFTNSCGHHYCQSCLEKAFMQGYNQVRTIKCVKVGCAGMIEKNKYQEFKNPSQSVQSNAMPAPVVTKFICVKCIKQFDRSKLFINAGCRHALCEDCVLGIGGIRLCQEVTCSQIIDTVAFNDYRASLQRQRGVMSQTAVQQKSPQQPIIEETAKCDGCFRSYKTESIYTNICGHQVCKSCADKQIQRQQPRFLCFHTLCRAQFDTSEIQKYFYQKIQQQVEQRCVSCSFKFIPYSLFKIDRCTHYLCFDCIAKKALSGRPLLYCPSPGCGLAVRIDQDQLEAFYIQKQTDMIEQIERSQMEEEQQQQVQTSKDYSKNPINGQMVQEKKDPLPQDRRGLDQKQPSDSTIAVSNIADQEKQRLKDQMEVENIYDRCSNCGSRINQYNLQIEVNCKKGHQLGTCCVPDDGYCPQCLNKRSEQEDQKLHLAFKMKMGSIFYEKGPSYASSIMSSSKAYDQPYGSYQKRY